MPVASSADVLGRGPQSSLTQCFAVTGAPSSPSMHVERLLRTRISVKPRLADCQSGLPIGVQVDRPTVDRLHTLKKERGCKAATRDLIRQISLVLVHTNCL